MKYIIAILFFFGSYYIGFSQQINTVNDDSLAAFIVKKTIEPIILDGELTESVWQEIGKAQNFCQYMPTDSIAAWGQTEIAMAYNDKYLYVGIKCYTKGADYIINSLKRDYSFFGTDNISLVFDTYADKTNAFLFGINPYGVLREALISNGGREGGSFSGSWDNKWKGQAKRYDTYWIAEIEIPFSTFRFNPGAEKWRFNAYRSDTQNNEISNWINIPRNRIVMDLTYMGNMVWEEPLKKQRKTIAVIPYSSGSAIRDFEDITENNFQTKYNFGGDAKIGITAGLNLDLTANPDFSQVEVDQQVTNLGRFELFFPERRQFFLENADLFSRFGGSRITPFFSRRIGVAKDTATDENIQNNILYGARLSGKINDRLRVGLMNIQTAQDATNDLPSFNYTVAAVEKNVFNRSSLAFILVNKQAINPDNLGSTYHAYNRTLGIEYRHASTDNRWDGKVAYHHIFSPTSIEEPFFSMAKIGYTRRKFRFEMTQLYVGEGYQPEVGFVSRRDMLFLSPEFSYNFFPKDKKITKHTIGFDYRHIYKLGKDDNEVLEDFGWIESRLETYWDINFLNTSSLRAEVNYQDLVLLSDFDPTRIQEDSVFLAAGTRHRFTNFQLSYRSDRRAKFSFRLTPTIGTFYNGRRLGMRGQIRYRYQQYGTIALNANYNYIKLNDPFVPSNLWLVGPRIDLTFSKKLFLTTFIQYNNQQSNLNINARLQWRFQPVSDFFLVFTDNYITDPFDQFAVRNRAFVAKITYWLNL